MEQGPIDVDFSDAEHNVPGSENQEAFGSEDQEAPPTSVASGTSDKMSEILTYINTALAAGTFGQGMTTRGRPQPLDEGLKINLRGPTCLIRLGVHSKEDSRCLVVHRGGITYSCKNAECEKIGSRQFNNIIPPEKLQTWFKTWVTKEVKEGKKKRKRTADTSGLNLEPHQQLLLDVMEFCQKKGLKKHDNILYCAAKNKQGWPTIAYKRFKKMETLVMELSSVHSNKQAWAARTKKSGYTKQIVDELCRLTEDDPYLPTMKGYVFVAQN